MNSAPIVPAHLIGLDACLAVMEVFYRDFNDPEYPPAPLLKEINSLPIRR